jgi:coenzyme F420-0:L-glutamate ligase/coenzyme F420-1:gamma-L-glutamate ligase
MSERALIVETPHGFVCANAGIDHSNVPGGERVTLLPEDPDDSARRFAQAVRKRSGARVAVIVSDTWGRPWREGQVNVAIGTHGLRVLADWRGRRDAHGRRLTATILAVADELAAAAGLAMGKADQVPVVVIRGYRFRGGRDSARKLLRPAAHDLFR